eukprot:6176175-Pleurochrysis_carterae.AAC.1
MDGQPRASDFRSYAAYVMQSENTHASLTVRETLEFAAELRLDPKLSPAAKAQRVSETLDDVGLMAVADNRIGDDVVGGLSGGQRRRVTVAIELINRPKLLFLDEPTSGLDSYGALQASARAHAHARACTRARMHTRPRHARATARCRTVPHEAARPHTPRARPHKAAQPARALKGGRLRACANQRASICVG